MKNFKEINQTITELELKLNNIINEIKNVKDEIQVHQESDTITISKADLLEIINDIRSELYNNILNNISNIYYDESDIVELSLNSNQLEIEIDSNAINNVIKDNIEEPTDFESLEEISNFFSITS